MNKFSVLLILLLFIAPTLAGADKPDALTLSQAYELALKQSEVLKLNEQGVLFAEAQYREAFAAMLPNIHINATERIRSSDRYGISDQPNAVTDEPGGGPAIRRSTRDEREFQTFFSLQQPLFTGFREFFISEALKSEVKAREYDHSRFKQLLFLDVASVYYQIVFFDRDINLLTKEEEVLDQRIKELNNFISLGRSKQSEVLAVDSDLAEVLAAKENIKGLLNAAKELLAFLSGVPAQEITLLPDLSNTQISPLEQYLEKATKRFDVQALQARQDSAEKQLTAAHRERWPELRLEANAYPYEDPDLNREWDAFIRFDLPIFEGGAISARIDQSQAELRSRQLLLQETKRSAEREVRVAYAQAQASLAQVQALRKLVLASEKNRHSQQGDYKLGIVNNLEVLDAIRSEQSARRQLLAAESGLQINIRRVEVAAGEPT